MESLSELEAWILELAAKADTTQGLKRPVWLARGDLVAVLRPLNTDKRAGLSWTHREERELDDALSALLRAGFLDKPETTPQSVERRIFGLTQRLAALEEGRSPTLDSRADSGPYRITEAGWVQLRAMDEAKLTASEQDAVAELQGPELTAE